MASLSFQRALWIITIIVVIGFSAVFLLPKNSPIQESRLNRTLPEYIGSWKGTTVQVGKREREILAADTEFLRKNYRHVIDAYVAPNTSYDPPIVDYRSSVYTYKSSIDVSVVFSGKDMNNSIHRPENCLRAQGWQFLEEETIVLKGLLPNGEDFPVRRILVQQTARESGAKGKVILTPSGEPLQIQRVQYYTFLGADAVTASHYNRTFTDILDRIRYGYDQKWAYATFSTEVVNFRAKQMGYESNGNDLEETEKMLIRFLRKALPEMVKDPKHPVNLSNTSNSE